MTKNELKELQKLSYHESRLLSRLLGAFKIKGDIPEGFDVQYFMLLLFMRGYAIVTDIDGVKALAGAISGINYANRPKHFETANPDIRNKKGVIGVDGVVVYPTPYKNYNPLYIRHLISHYSNKLNAIDKSVDISLNNSRIPFIFFAVNEAEKEQMAKIYDDINSGKPAVVEALDLFNNEKMRALDVKGNYITDLLLRDELTIYNDFLSEVGINNNPIEKKERLVVGEVESNNDDVEINRLNIIDSIQEGLDEVNKLYGINLTVEYATKERNVESENNDNNLGNDDDM